MNIQKSNLNPNSLSFRGHKKLVNEFGYDEHKFFYLFDPKKYSCELELYNIDKDKNGNYTIVEKKAPAAKFDLPEDGLNLDLRKLIQLNQRDGFAYRFKLTDKDTKNVSYAFDNGSVIGHEVDTIFDTTKTDNKYNLILSNRATINKNGIQQLIMTDEYYPGVEEINGKTSVNDALRAQALASVRTHANKLGGNFYGIIHRLPELKKEGIERIVGTPFTKDTISSHLYWTENAYQIAPSLGDEQSYKKLQIELFKNGINWISDAALVNEGFGGIHISELLRKGSDSYAKNMFRADERLLLGILPDKCDYTRMKVINAPFVVTKEGKFKDSNPDYNPAKPTYIQYYDSRLASEEQQTSNSPSRLTTYDNKNTDNIYDITRHDDAVYPFPIEVDPYLLARNVKNEIKHTGYIDLNCVDDISTIKNLSKFGTFEVTNKSNAGGIELWDGNVDIPKLNFFRSDKDDSRFTKLPASEKAEAIADFERGTLAVRDYAINSCKYWTKLTADTQFEYVGNSVAGTDGTVKGYKEKIDNLIKQGLCPSPVYEINENVIENVLNDSYHLRRLDDADMRSEINPDAIEGNDYSFKEYILRQSMDVPLETLPIATNLLGIITSPYIAKRANVRSELAVSRYDISKANNPNLPEKYRDVYSQVDNIYANGVTKIIESILKDIPNVYENGEITEYGKYVVSEAAPDLTRYILVKSLAPNTEIPVSEDGHIDFTAVNPENITMQSIGIPYSGKTEKEEAETVVNVMLQNFAKMKPADFAYLKTSMENRFKNRTLNDFKIAEMIMDRTESGLGWRIDASKDIVSIDSARSNAADMENLWDNTIDFWGLCNQVILGVNNHAYTTVELTDLAMLFPTDKNAKYTSDADAERKMNYETGMITPANYNYFYSLFPELFAGASFEDGNINWMSDQGKNHEYRNKLDAGWCGTNPGFLFQTPDDGVVNSYTFVGNHDKPRVLHCLALNMNLFHYDFNKIPRIQKEIQEKQKELAAEQAKLSNDTLKKEEKEQIEAKIEELQKNINDKNNDLNNKNESLGTSALERDTQYRKLAKSFFGKANNDVCTMSLAMGVKLLETFDEIIPNNSQLRKKIESSIKTLANGEFKGRKFDPVAFGTRPFDVAIKSVLDQIEYTEGTKIKNREVIEANALQYILEPAYQKYYSIYKALVTTPGSPTDFAGDRLGNSGYETKAKNYYQQNRNVIHWEWLDDSSGNLYKFVRKFYQEMNNIANLRTRSELSALNDGATVTLPILKENGTELSEQVQGILRYNDKGSVVITLQSNSNNPPEINKIPLNNSVANSKQGMKHGLKEGDKFKKVDDLSNTQYVVKKDDKTNEYYLAKIVENIINGIPTYTREPIKIEPSDHNTLVLYKI